MKPPNGKADLVFVYIERCKANIFRKLASPLDILYPFSPLPDALEKIDTSRLLHNVIKYLAQVGQPDRKEQQQEEGR